MLTRYKTELLRGGHGAGARLLAYFYIPKSARAYLFPQSVKNHYYCSGPISLDPICPQSIGMGMGRARAWHVIGVPDNSYEHPEHHLERLAE